MAVADLTIEIECVTGAAIETILPAFAQLRIDVFREYPYLYVGSLAYEKKYLATYASSPDCLVVVARDGDRIVGASTALPLASYGDEVVPPLVGAGYDPATVCYFGESILVREYRGRGLGHTFFEHRERHARERGYALATFCAVERPDDHPRRPADYRPLHGLWATHGFVRRPDIATTFSWRDADERDETAKPMIFWTKELS